jgi:branched-chain amino acid transport system ATP-binding protein
MRHARQRANGALELQDVSFAYDGVPVLRHFTLRLEPGTVAVVAGGDGGGKTTLARVAAGFLRPAAGRVAFAGRDMTFCPAHRFARAGIVLAAPELVNGRLTVADNLRLAARYGAGAAGPALLRLVAAALGRFPDLARRTAQPAASLSSGQRVMLCIARALCAAPRVLILDEPGIGLFADTLGRVAAVVAETAAAGGAVLITEADPGHWGYPAVTLGGRAPAAPAPPAGDPTIRPAARRPPGAQARRG